jgi:chromosome condensin MukBEF MukE localization factor
MAFKMNFKHVFYADCESSIDDFHAEYNICFVRADGRCRIQIFGKRCVLNFLERMPTESLIYFHNLSYDINFIIKKLYRVSNPIIKN